MSDMEKMIRGLEHCSNGGCEDCPYEHDLHLGRWVSELVKDALELLKEQDKTIKSLTEEKEALLLERIAELQHNIDALHATMLDTMLVNNAIEQRKAVKWDD